MNKNYKNPNKVLDDVIEKSILKEEITTLKKLLVESNKELWELKEIEKEHQRINGELRVENKGLKDRIDKAVEITHKILMNNADNRMICVDEEKEYFDWLDKEMLNQEKILKGDKETPDLFKEAKTITEIPPIPKNMDTSHLQEFIDELKGDKQ